MVSAVGTRLERSIAVPAAAAALRVGRGGFADDGRLIDVRQNLLAGKDKDRIRYILLLVHKLQLPIAKPQRRGEDDLAGFLADLKLGEERSLRHRFAIHHIVHQEVSCLPGLRSSFFRIRCRLFHSLYRLFRSLFFHGRCRLFRSLSLRISPRLFLRPGSLITDEIFLLIHPVQAGRAKPQLGGKVHRPFLIGEGGGQILMLLVGKVHCVHPVLQRQAAVSLADGGIRQVVQDKGHILRVNLHRGGDHSLHGRPADIHRIYAALQLTGGA